MSAAGQPTFLAFAHLVTLRGRFVLCIPMTGRPDVPLPDG